MNRAVRGYNLRHTAALALVGWYLMLPLPKHPDAPIARWAHVDSFDSATECRDAAYHLIDRAKKNHDQAKLDTVMGFECIATDDPRLKEK